MIIVINMKMNNPACNSKGPRIFIVTPESATHEFKIGSCSPYTVMGPWAGCILKVSKPL
jgi:hypothetical protein